MRNGSSTDEGTAQVGQWWNCRFIWPHLGGSICFVVKESFGNKEAGTRPGQQGESMITGRGWYCAPLLSVPGGSPKLELTQSHHDGLPLAFYLPFLCWLSWLCWWAFTGPCCLPARDPHPIGLVDIRENEREARRCCFCKAQPLERSSMWIQWVLPLHMDVRTWVWLERRVCWVCPSSLKWLFGACCGIIMDQTFSPTRASGINKRVHAVTNHSFCLWKNIIIFTFMVLLPLEGHRFIELVLFLFFLVSFNSHKRKTGYSNRGGFYLFVTLPLNDPNLDSFLLFPLRTGLLEMQALVFVHSLTSLFSSSQWRGLDLLPELSALHRCSFQKGLAGGRMC